MFSLQRSWPWKNNIRKLARVVLDEPLAILISYHRCDQISSRPELAGKLNCEIFTDVDKCPLVAVALTYYRQLHLFPGLAKTRFDPGPPKLVYGYA